MHFPITARHPQDIIAYRDGGAVTVADLLTQARQLSASLPGHRYVFNMFSNRYQYLLGFCASVMAGQCTLMPPNRLEKTLRQLQANYPDSYFLEDLNPSIFENLQEPGASDSHSTGDLDIPGIPAKQLCAVAFTSGSTGSPSPNLKYWETLWTSTRGNAELLLPKRSQLLNVVATVPPQHMWGMETSILLPLLSNTAISDRTPFYPQDIADALAAVPGPRALVSSPAHLKVLLKSGLPLADIDVIFSATAPLPRELAQQLEDRFRTRVLEAFGCTESGVVAARVTTEEDLWRVSDLFEFVVQDDGVLIKAPHLPVDVALQDIIKMADDRHFKWLGRHQDMVNIAGKRGSLADLNRCLLAIDGVVDGVIFQPDDQTERLAAMVVSPGLTASQILKKLKLEVDAVFLPRPVYLVQELPRQETGKLANSGVMGLYRELVAARNSGKRTHA